MKHTRWRAGGSCLVAVSLLAAACGGDSEQLTELKDQVAALEEKLEQATTTVAPTTSPTATTTSTTSAPATTTTTTTPVPATTATATATASTTTQVPTTTHTPTTTQVPTTTEAPLLAAIRQRYPAWQNGCSGMGSVMFSNSPMRPEDFESLLPYGKIVGAHVTPIDHMYFSPADWSLGHTYNPWS